MAGAPSQGLSGFQAALTAVSRADGAKEPALDPDRDEQGPAPVRTRPPTTPLIALITGALAPTACTVSGTPRAARRWTAR
ncbi:hypothetical protein CNX65_26010 [Actinosynnema pretiosum]|uniref:Uncharacterized protein n=1 Tax=Actinosynnema pretiosum TaxID=42197 RepID=A0A290ZBA5_9PSEU|nr:hypothetical protein CNX65_26010 [Actinosynnema pretiosum]